MLGLNSIGQQQFNADIISAAVSSVLVALRFVCKIWHKQGVRSDDWCILAALGCFWGSVGCVTWGRVEWGDLKDLMLVMERQDNTAVSKHMSNYLKALLIGNTCLVAAFYACRLSVLMFYRRLFFVSATYRHLTLAMILLSTIWFLATLTTNWLSCVPIQAFWNRALPGKCIDFNALCLAAGILDTIVDLLIILLPVRMVCTLYLPRKTKVAISGLFALGGFVVITDIMRTKYMYRPGEAFISTIEAERWSNIHMVTVFACASLPVYKPLWSSLISKASGWLKRLSNHRPTVSAYDSTHVEVKADLHVRSTGSVGTASRSIKEEGSDYDRGSLLRPTMTRSTDNNESEQALYT